MDSSWVLKVNLSVFALLQWKATIMIAFCEFVDCWLSIDKSEKQSVKNNSSDSEKRVIFFIR